MKTIGHILGFLLLKDRDAQTEKESGLATESMRHVRKTIYLAQKVGKSVGRSQILQ